MYLKLTNQYIIKLDYYKIFIFKENLFKMILEKNVDLDRRGTVLAVNTIPTRSNKLFSFPRSGTQIKA